MHPFIAGSLISGGAGILGGLLGRKSPKIPAPKTATQMKSDMDVMYSGTTPWERLGASGGGVPQAAASQDQAKIAARVQQQQHKNQMQIASINAASMLYKAQLEYKAKIKTDAMGAILDPATATEGLKQGYEDIKQGVMDFVDKHLQVPNPPSKTLSDKPNRADAGRNMNKESIVDIGEMLESIKVPQPTKRSRHDKGKNRAK